MIDETLIASLGVTDTDADALLQGMFEDKSTEEAMEEAEIEALWSDLGIRGANGPEACWRTSCTHVPVLVNNDHYCLDFRAALGAHGGR